MRPRLAISFSGGESSAVMTKLCLEKYGQTHDIVVTFANTGCEHEATLRFVRDCDEHFHFNTVWIEAEITQGERIGPKARVVNFASASRDGRPFEDSIRKHGIPSQSHPQCTSRLKLEPMQHYLRSIGWESGSYETAIGIRVDEIDRVSASRSKHRLIYPLCDAGIGRPAVKRIVSEWPFKLELPGSHYGNCTFCFKKSERKLRTLAVESPEVFEFPSRMERQYGTHLAENDAGIRRFFRGNRSTADIIEASRLSGWVPFKDSLQPEQLRLSIDVGGGCGETCEVWADID